jgi:hypothetical protein
MGQLALESGPAYVPEPAEEDVWAAQKLKGFVEIGSRDENGVDLRLWWRELGNVVLLGAHTERGDHIVTMIDGQAANDSLDHPSQYFSHEASQRLFQDRPTASYQEAA